MTIFRKILLLYFTFLLAGCSNWASMNKPVTFVPELLKTIDASPKRPILITDTQRNGIIASLRGPVKKEFLADDLLPEIWASRSIWKEGQVVMVRYPKDKAGYSAWIGYDIDGTLFLSGGGRPDVEPPWKK